MRKKLGLKTEKSHGVLVIVPSEAPKLARLYEKYGIKAERTEISKVKSRRLEPGNLIGWT